MTNGLITSVENTIKPIWKSSYVAYKRAAVSVSCYINDSWEKLQLPFTHISDWLQTKMSMLSNSSYGFILNIFETVWDGMCTIFSLFRDGFTNIWMFLFDFFSAVINMLNNALQNIFGWFGNTFLNFTNGIFWICGGAWEFLSNIIHNLKSLLYLIPLAPKSSVLYQPKIPIASEEGCVKQSSIDKLSHDVNSFKSVSWDLSALKKKVDELEMEILKEKESRKSQDEWNMKKIEESHKTLQKYQATINQALVTSRRPTGLSTSAVQYFLDNQSETLKQWITQNFLLKSDSPDIDEEKIGFLIAKYSNKTGSDLLELKKEFGKFVLNHKYELENLRNEYNSMGINNIGGDDISVTYIKKLIADAIKLYDADKTGRVDYALETAGGQVLSIRCTETYIASPKSYILLGWNVYTKTSSPRDAISPGMAAGQCWAFTGSQGFLVLQLSHVIKVTGFSLEHISKLLVPKGHIESAPKNFSMWGLRSEHDVEPYLFGEYTYLDNEETLQYFPVVYPTSEPFNIVELKITSNYGNPNYTCLYRIRVHGDLHNVQL